MGLGAGQRLSPAPRSEEVMAHFHHCSGTADTLELCQSWVDTAALCGFLGRWTFFSLVHSTGLAGLGSGLGKFGPFFFYCMLQVGKGKTKVRSAWGIEHRQRSRMGTL